MDPPAVPTGLEVDPGFEVARMEHAIGTQNYICRPAPPPQPGPMPTPTPGPAFAWVLFGPQATLFGTHGRQTQTHFLSPNPDEGGTLRATWQHSRDTSSVWAAAIAQSDDSAFVEENAIPWLKLEVKGTERGPSGGRTLIKTKFLQRINTSGGKAPTTGCIEAGQVGNRVFVPYTADYVFYEPMHGQQ
jgi:hypothetical protein